MENECKGMKQNLPLHNITQKKYYAFPLWRGMHSVCVLDNDIHWETLHAGEYFRILPDWKFLLVSKTSLWWTWRFYATGLFSHWQTWHFQNHIFTFGGLISMLFAPHANFEQQNKSLRLKTHPLKHWRKVRLQISPRIFHEIFSMPMQNRRRNCGSCEWIDKSFWPNNNSA